MNDTLPAQRMRKLIGTRFRYLQQDWVLIEVLVHEDAVILASEEAFAPIQGDQYGQATRRVPETISLAITDANGSDYSEEMLELLAGKR